ncbi:MAG TPA: ABC transporter, partial [Nitrospiraceae bacterium]|nr:ABC transporter [Nitrospiraceae bacterium]
MIIAEDIRKEFRLKGGAVVEAVKGVSFHVKQGEIFGFLGPNG